MLNLFKYWRRIQRSTDMTILWPACKEHAESLDQAKAAFYFHVSNDLAWTKDYDEQELKKFVGEMK